MKIVEKQEISMNWVVPFVVAWIILISAHGYRRSHQVENLALALTWFASVVACWDVHAVLREDVLFSSSVVFVSWLGTGGMPAPTIS